jgi:signal transduction histidine kinase/CheY-like chemotaxis protein
MVWLGYMSLAIVVRTWVISRLEYKPQNITNPQRDMKQVAFAVSIVGLGWGLAWPLMMPDLDQVARMIYVYMITATMIASMFAYSVDRRTFFIYTLTIMLPAVLTILWKNEISTWPYNLGLLSLYMVVLGIARSFSKIFEESVNMRFRNESLYRELAAERDQSIAANVAKSEFISAASHDLRQPLHAINLIFELINFKELSPQNSAFLGKIRGSIEALNSMFETLLSMSKIDSHASQVHRSHFELSELTRSVGELVQHHADNKGVKLVIDAPACTLDGDKLLLQQILVNLVMNAIQYTHVGSVSIQFKAENGLLSFDVSDTGIGISDEDQVHIFNEFYRVQRTQNMHEGLGLGLSIVKRLCKLTGSQILLRSKLGAGSTFTVQTSCPVFSESKQTGHKAALGSRQLEKTSDLSGRCIAIIEDDEVINAAYKQTLSSLGAHVVVLSERDAELQQQLESIDHIDCIVSDYRLRYTTGDQIIEKLRENFNDDIPAVIVTADTSPGNLVIFENTRATVLFKPLTFKAIVSAIEEALKIPKPSSAIEDGTA